MSEPQVHAAKLQAAAEIVIHYGGIVSENPDCHLTPDMRELRKKAIAYLNQQLAIS